MIGRRTVIASFGSAAIARPLAAAAQATPQRTLIGYISGRPLLDAYIQRQVQAFEEELHRLGWTAERGTSIAYRSGAGDAVQLARVVREILDLHPAVIVASTTSVAEAVQRETRTTPIVFVAVSDPVASGLVAGFQRPDGNATGFVDLEPSISGKLVELLKQAVPGLAHAVCLFNPTLSAGGGASQVEPARAAAAALGVAFVAAPVRDAAEIELTIEMAAREPNSGLVLIPDLFNALHESDIIASAARHRLPAIGYYRQFSTHGGLAAYGVDYLDLVRRGATYVDRLLRGARPADLPVQLPTRFELVINLATARTLGIEVPSSLVARADEVVE
jgi:putative ABC transport system substrate-binding protein